MATGVRLRVEIRDWQVEWGFPKLGVPFGGT